MLLHPSIIFLVGALLLPFFRHKARQYLLLSVPAISFIVLVNLPEGQYWSYHFLNYDLLLGRVDRLSQCFGYVFVVMAFLGMVYALHLRDTTQHIATFLHIAGALGVVLAGDLLTLWFFWEIMSLSAVFLIWSQRSKAALAAGFRYIFVHLSGGACLLTGILLHLKTTGSLDFSILSGQGGGGVSSYLILIGFLINAAVPPFSAWLSDAYPEATITGSVFLTCYATKSAVYVLIRGFPGLDLLVWAGAIMAIYGVIFAVLQNDIRRLLAYHIISQVGYMVCGVGLGSQMALNGATAHAFCHILYKALLFMGTGAVIYSTGRRNLTELGGGGQGQRLSHLMPWVLILYMIGAFSISGVPLFNGFISKSITISAAAIQKQGLIELLLILASIGTFLSVALKLPYFTWFGSSRNPSLPVGQIPNPNKLPVNMLWAMGLMSGLCIFLGCFPNMLYRILPYPLKYQPYTPDHIVGTMQLLVMTAVVFFLLSGYLKGRDAITLDTDWFYRRLARLLIWFIRIPLSDARTKLQTTVGTLVNYCSGAIYRTTCSEPVCRPDGVGTGRRSESIGRTPNGNYQFAIRPIGAIGRGLLVGLVLLFLYVILLYL
ncbi:MAG: Na(+)/H(+) antiporter subunit D [Planctomycetota bacterium]|nr:Na(+)/H(+) antiporter subunit D [Planctomycetota bacterium]